MTAAAADSAPDWSLPNGSSTTELHCPLCEYNLRGLVEPRCPECGFAFRWAELIEGQTNKHPYLFEHQNRRNIWSFCKTYWNDSFPRRFWRDLNPAHPVRLFRLILYWCLANSALVLLILGPFVWHVVDLANANAQARKHPVPIPGNLNVFTQVLAGGPMVPMPPPNWAQLFPSPTEEKFYEQLLNDISVRDFMEAAAPPLTVLAWPWLSFAALMVFRTSMHTARINPQHVLRTVIYGCNFLIILTALILPLDHRNDLRSWPFYVVCLCPLLALYRIYFAYSRYLRFHLPFFTVLTSQVIVFLFMIVMLLNLHIVR